MVRQRYSKRRFTRGINVSVMVWAAGWRFSLILRVSATTSLFQKDVNILLPQGCSEKEMSGRNRAQSSKKMNIGHWRSRSTLPSVTRWLQSIRHNPRTCHWTTSPVSVAKNCSESTAINECWGVAANVTWALTGVLKKVSKNNSESFMKVGNSVSLPREFTLKEMLPISER
jgi:hypothetical protein